MTKNKLIYSNNEKYAELLRVSNPERVIENAIKYFNDPNIEVYLSPAKNKKYMIFTPDYKKRHFGNIDYSDYTKHLNTERREAYLRRATKIRGKWKDDPYSPNSLSINLLWE